MGKAEAPRTGGFLSSEGPGTISRDQVVLVGLNDGLTTYQSGKVLGQVLKGATSVAVASGNTGNGTIGAITRFTGLLLGTYQLVCIKAATNGGVFTVEDPAGYLLGESTVGVAFSGGGLSFTIADGTSDFAVGDRFSMTVAAGDGRYRAWDPTGFDGREVACAVLYAPADVSASDVNAAAITRNAEVKDALLDFGSASTDQIASAKIQLESVGILVRSAL